MRNLIIGICICFYGNFLLAQDTTQIIMPNRINNKEQIKKPYVLLISADGFRYDLADKYHAKNLLRLSKTGVKAAFLQPSYPSLTFPNHYAIATGMYPSHNGLVDNNMYDKQKNAIYSIGNKKEVGDSSWYGGTPIWVLAEQQQMLSASFYWVGSEAAINGVRPTYYYKYNEKINIDNRINEVKKWLELPEEKRPHLITFYLPEVDHAEHKTGTESKETEEAVGFIDETIAKITATLSSLDLDIDYIFVSDHGMTNVDTKNTISFPAVVDTSKFKITAGSSLIHLYAKNPVDIIPAYNNLKVDAKDYDVYLANDIPENWHYSHKDDVFNRVGDIILVPHLPKVFQSGKYPTQLGHHGFDPLIPEMRATFYAWGPDFKKHQKIPGFENIHIYPLIAKVLGLTITQPIDGDLKVLEGILK